MQLLFRFLIGGLVVSLFAVIGDTLKPKSFAGLFGAAPSVALATLALTVFSEGKPYIAQEARSMIAGAIGMGLCAWATMKLITRLRWHGMAASVAALTLWFACSLGIWLLALR